jgi:hypothetical protein
MTIVTNTWRQLVQRRLWPVALLLLGALVAVPFLLAKSPAPVPAPPAATVNTVTASAASADPIVERVSDDEAPATRRVLGTGHDPFAVSAHPKKSKASKKQSTATTADDSAPAKSADPGASTGGTAPQADSTPTAPQTPKETVPAGSIEVRFGSSDDAELPRTLLKRDEALPDEKDPVLVYLGLKKDGKTAMFLVSEGLVATGDGSCKPSDTCETLELKVGETEFFDLAGDEDGTQFQLDVVKAYKNATKVASSSNPSSGTGSGATANASAKR